MEYPTVEAKGSKTLIEAFDQWLEVKPDKVYACVPESSNINDGLRFVTMREMACAIDSFAWALTEQYGRSDRFETIAYCGVNDLRYPVVFFALIKCGYKTLMLSPKNTPQQNAMLLQATDCKKVFLSPEFSHLAKAVSAILPDLTYQAIQEFDHWLNSYTRHYPFQRTLEQAKWDPVIILHSSGSTGPPKPVVINNGFIASAHTYMAPPPGRRLGSMFAFDFEGGGALFCPFPCCHLGGWTATCIFPVYSIECSVVFPLPDRPTTAGTVKTLMEIQPLRGVYAPPSLVEQIAAMAGGMELLAQLEFISYAGGPLARPCGDRLVKHGVKVCTVFGATETGPLKLLIPQPEDWAFFEFHPDWHCDMQNIVDGAYELVYHNDQPDSWQHGSFWTMPDLREYRTKDLFKPHPTKPGLWSFHARNDDIIIFSNGEKWNPLVTESFILSHPKVTGVFVHGEGREQPAALIEPKEVPESPEAFLEELWPTIEAANAHSQRQGVVTRSKVAFVEPAGLPRSVKNTVVKTVAREKYQELLDRLYSDTTNVVGYVGPVLGDYGDLRQSLQIFVRECTTNLSPLSREGFNDEDDFYVNGVDSVQTLELARMLKMGLKPRYGDLPWLTGQTIFDFPCVANLADALETFLSQEEQMDGDKSHAALDAVEAMIAKHINDMPEAMPDKAHPAISQPGELSIAITGSTGSLGMRLLQCLLASSHVRHVYCLDRSTNARDRIAAAMPTLNMPPGKVTFLQSQWGDAQLGLPSEIYQGLAQGIDAIIHNAWKVDFNHSLASFEPVHVRGVSNLIRFSHYSPKHPRIVFVSSVASVGNYHEPRNQWELVPEEIIDNPNVAQKMGYGQSKYVSERILAAAPTKAGVPTTILRAGQIAGPVGLFPDAVGPSWNKAEYIPSIIETARNLGNIPGDVSEVDWFPVDVLAKVIVDDLMMHDLFGDPAHIYAKEVVVYNLTNPRLASWAGLMEAVQARFGGPDSCPLVPWQHWIDQVKQFDADNEIALARFPVLKLLRFFEVVDRQSVKSRLATRKTETCSQTMQALGAIRPEWMDFWLQQWGY